MQRDLLTPLSLPRDAKLGEKHIFLAFIWGINTIGKNISEAEMQNPTNWLNQYLLLIDIINVWCAKVENSSKLISCYLRIELNWAHCERRIKKVNQ